MAEPDNAVAAAQASAPIPPDVPAPPTKASQNVKISVRRATLLDAAAISRLHMQVNFDGPLTNFMFPQRHAYPADFAHTEFEITVMCMLNPRNLTFVAFSADKPNEIVGYMQCVRLGDDEGARRQIASRTSPLRSLEKWEYATRFKVWNWLWPDRSVDVEKREEFMGPIVQQQTDLHWKPYPERDNRWFVQRIGVSPDCQGQGIGRLLMEEVLSKARDERVCIGLASSAQGEYLYKKLGFELLGRFDTPIEDPGSEGMGGIMIWWPEGI